MRALEIFGPHIGEMASDQTLDRSVGVDQHQWATALREVAAERPRQADEILDVAAVHQLKAGDGAQTTRRVKTNG